jgi:hypothetical protein
MKQRGRKSAASQGLPVASPQTQVVRRPDAPLDLTPEESQEWNRVTEAMPADWFSPESFPLLSQYCRHIVSARRVSQLIDQEIARTDVDVAQIDKLLQMQSRETASLKAMAASMRLSQQASYSARGAGGEKSRRNTVKRPWEDV